MSKIPFIEDWQAFQGDVDVWCNCQEFLDIQAGDWEEHSILLANYISILSSKTLNSYLVTGVGIPEGETVYVMVVPSEGQSNSKWVKEHFGIKGGGERADEVVFVNASCGTCFLNSDEKCPLQEIHTIVGKNNIWANIQRANHPSHLRYDLNDLQNWDPFFNINFPFPQSGLSSIQPSSIYYRETERSYVLQVERELLKSIRLSLRRWRSKSSITTFHSETSNAFSHLLERCEDIKRGIDVDMEEEKNRLLRNVSKTRSVYGVPLNFSFTEIQAIENSLLSTQIHKTEHPEVQFGLAVRVFPFHCSILSVWVFLGTVTPNR